MKKLLTLFAAAMMLLGAQNANAQSDAEYYDALASIDNGAQYYITTDVSGTKYYLTTSGSLTNDIASAGQFTMTQVTGGEYKSTGFKIYGTTYFSNPNKSDDNGTINNEGHLNTNADGRATWEAQVLFLKKDNGKYAVRSTNAAESGNGWNLVGKAFWAVNNGPVAEYSHDVNYIWDFEKVGDVTYTALSATKFNNGEGAEKLIDGIGQTKWGESLTTGNPRWLIFKTDRAINATEYMLTVANDTPGSTGRQWKKWKIYGANFYSDALAAASTGNDGWVLLDQKSPSDADFPIGSGNNTYNHTDFTMSENNSGYYQYFKIVVEELRSSGQYGQMGDFRFKTFTAKTEAETWTSKVTLAKAVNFDPQTLGTSYPLYTELQSLITDTTLDTYLNAGNYTSLKGKLEEVYELQRVMTAYLGGRDFLGIVGSDGCWGDGHYDNLVDGDNTTKWGGNFPGSGEKVLWMIFRAKEDIKPYFYKLLTAWDAQSWAGRNWKNWTIKGGNFATMDAAQRGASGWTVIDSRTNVGQDLLPAKNGHLAPFGVNGTFSDEFYYFLVEVTECYNNGTQIQMNELTLGTEAEFSATKTAYLDELNDYVVPDAATNEQKTAYAAAITDVENATPENILEKYIAAKAVQSNIFQSLKDGNGFYQITSPVDLELFSDLVNAGEEDGEPAAKGKLTANIDLAGFSLTIIGGNSDFKGELNGQGYTISHLSDYNSAGWKSGLIGQANGATIYDIVFEDANIEGRNSVSVVVGEATNCTIENILVQNSVVKTISGGDRLGAIAGQVNGGIVQNCAVLNSTVEGHNYVGAITGNAIGGATVKNCYSDSDVEAKGSWAGGIAGAAQTATIEKNLFTGTLKSAYDRASGLVGLFNVKENNDYILVLQKNMVAASTIIGPTTNSLMYVPTFPTGQTTAVSYTGNYLLKSTVYSDGSKILTHENDLNGKQISWIDATTKDFYVTTLGWDFTNTWKFTCGGKYPILKIMADEAFPTQDVTVTSAGYATMVAQYDYDFTSAPVETYAVTTSATPGYVHLEPVTSAKHGEALLLKGGTDTYTLTATAAAKDVTAENLLKAAEEDVVSYGTKYALAKIDGIVGFYQVGTAESAVTIPAGKAYLDGVPSSVKAYIFDFDDDATGLNAVNGEGFMVNGPIYNLAGQRVNKMQKGINIVNGKKVMVK